ncbi:DUF2510 domain-containing protein [Mycolicibacterium setense]
MQPHTPAQGWYADPADQTMARWWDGNRWTSMVQPLPPAAPTPPPHPLQPVAHPPPYGPEAVYRRKSLLNEEIRADADSITCDSTTLRWSDAEWYGYSITNLFYQDYFMLGIKVGKPQDIGSDLVFSVGRGQRTRIPGPNQILLKFTGRDQDRAHWQGLVALCRHHLEPRLRGTLVNRMRAGERVSMGNIYAVDANGLHYPHKNWFFPWANTQIIVDNGMVILIPPTGRKKDQLGMTPDHPNAQLVPYLQSVFTGRS